eukprot:TRINITY_DN10904_c0_g1_i1.p2 TRINITY_DN10904_c0_g1~~TRINITY_DN10904_c0_g1_i1.p2  ORF type:complete len:166 (+),score=9.95 TRINITY_DN10904_c0_g1_i1:60-557(+)
MRWAPLKPARCPRTWSTWTWDRISSPALSTSPRCRDRSRFCLKALDLSYNEFYGTVDLQHLSTSTSVLAVQRNQLTHLLSLPKQQMLRLMLTNNPWRCPLPNGTNSAVVDGPIPCLTPSRTETSTPSGSKTSTASKTETSTPSRTETSTATVARMEAQQQQRQDC